jgi:hypothetical protein
MQLPQTGGCHCRKLRYEITEAPQQVLHLPLHRLSADNQQRLLDGDCRRRECISPERD